MNNKKHFPSLSISASAGCGKTEAMGIRLLALFLMNIDEPQRVFGNTLAATFSRSGAKEIYDRILKLIFEHLNKNEIEKLNSKLSDLNMGLPQYSRKDFIRLLRALIISINELKICTLDSFMNRIVNTFHIELGLPRKPELVTSSEEIILLENTFKKLLLHYDTSKNDPEKEMRDLANNCKKVMYGKEKHNYFAPVSSKILSILSAIDDYPDIQPFSLPENFEEKFPFTVRISQLNLLLANQTKARITVTKTKASLYQVLEKIAYAGKNTYFNNKELARIRDFYDQWQNILQGNFSTVPSFAKEFFENNEKDAVIYLLEYASHILLYKSCIRTEALLDMAHQFREKYKDVFYAQGKLTFQDLARLLDNANNDWTYEIAYRLNSSLNNFFIDEFQDTSRLQWRITEPLLDRNSEDDDKSLFIVGDVKQAIYNWRSGDRRLMGDVAEKMQILLGLEKSPLNNSYRYGSSVCNAINHIFDGNSIANAGFLKGAGHAWKNAFEVHKAADSLKYKSIFHAYMLEKNDENTSVFNIHAQLILEILKKENFISKKSSCAIIVREKKHGLELLEVLRKDEKIGDLFIWNGKQNICEEKLIISLLNMLIYIQHPADSMAKEIAYMFRSIRDLIPRTAESLNIENGRLLHEGFYTYLKNCISKILRKSECQLSSSEQETVELFLQAAYDFDHSSIAKDSRLFMQYVQKVEHSEEIVGYKIPIMTIHRSKGMTFDHAFAVFDSTESVIKREKNISVTGRQNGTYRILHEVNSEFSVFEEIDQAWSTTCQENVFEDICNFYVALTRAKFSATLLLGDLAKEKIDNITRNRAVYHKSSYFFTDYLAVKLFFGTFATDTVCVDNKYLMRHMCIEDKNSSLPIEYIKTEENIDLPPVNFKMQPSQELRRRRIRPSDGFDSNEPDGGKKLYFNLPDSTKGSLFGDNIHRILCSIEDFSDFELPPACSQKVKDEISNITANPQLAALLSGADECWREKSFDVVINNYYISGCFDRVQIKRNADGKAIQVSVFDYKSGIHDTDNTEKLKRYRNQLNIYRQAASQLLSLPVTSVKCYLIWTADGTFEEIMP